MFESEVFAQIAEKKAELDKIIHEYGKAALKDVFNQFFAGDHQIEAVEWKHYTPGFNDGDPCVFTVTEASALIPSRGEGPQRDDFDSEDEYQDALEEAIYEESPPWYGTWDLWDYSDAPEGADWNVRREVRKSTPELEALTELNRLLQANQDTLYVVFGDNVAIRANKDGFDVREYDCGF